MVTHELSNLIAPIMSIATILERTNFDQTVVEVVVVV